MAILATYNLGDIRLSDGMSKSEDISGFVSDTVNGALGTLPPIPLSGDFSLEYDSENKKIYLKYSDESLGTVDCDDFVKDGMISDVSYDEGTHILSILWNSDGDSKMTEINLSGLIDTYTAGEGLKLENGEFSVKAELLDDISQAKSTANSASANSLEALTTATEAKAIAENTQSIAEEAQSMARDARGLALDAQENAAQARTTATEAQTTANAASTAASTADAKAEDALQGVADAMNYADGKDRELSANLTTDLQEWTRQQGYSNQFWSFGNGLSVIPPEPTRAAPAVDSNAPSVVVADTAVVATKEFVNEGHGYTFDEPLQVTDRGPAGKSVRLDFQPSDYYSKFVLDDCLSAVRPCNSPEEVPLSAIVNAIWCLSKLQEWVTPES